MYFPLLLLVNIDAASVVVAAGAATAAAVTHTLSIWNNQRRL